MPATASSQVLTSVRTVGGLLPADMLIRIAEGKDVSGSRPADYHVVGVRSVQDAAERHWDFLKGAWRALRDAIGDAGHDPSGLAIENWLLPLFEEHGFGRLERIPAGIQSTDRTATFPVTHRWRHVPIHLVGWDTDLDHRVPGGGLPPQSMLQECLNRSDEHLWGVLSNGRQLRLLRDSSALAGAAFIEIDLEAMFDGELFDEFVLLYRLLHVSRFEIPDGAAPSACWLEKWRTEAIEAGARALDQLRDGVADAIAHLGTGFLRHPANHRLREDLDADLFKRALLRLVYRLLFWFVAEDRDVLLHPDADQTARTRYQKYYSARAAARVRAAPHRHLARRPVAGGPARTSTLSATRTGCRGSAWPGSAGSTTTPAPTRSCAAWSCPTSTCSPRSSRWPGYTTSPPGGGGGWTTGTSARRNSARSTSRSSNWCRSGARRSVSSSST